MVFRFVLPATLCEFVCVGAVCLPPHDLSEAAPAIRDTDLVYDLGGGFAGIYHAVRISPDGQVSASDEHGPENLVGVLSDEQGNHLNALLEDWDALPDISEEAEPVFYDGFGYGMKYRGRTLSWSDGQENVPARLWEIAGLVASIEQGF
jgi:hypothetical protein